MHEDLIEEQSINVGYSFIKNIKPKETFSYDIIKITPNSDTYNNRIVILRRDEVERYLRISIDNKYLFQFPGIILN